MPFRCCVPNCKGNYNGGEKVSVFKFPTEGPLREKWISAIPRDKFVPSQSARVYIPHFQPSDVLWQTEVFDEKTGQKLAAPLKTPRLKNGAVPSVFPNCPSYLSREESCRESPVDKRSRLESSHLSEAISASLASQEHYNQKYCFNTLDELSLRLKNVTVPKPWTFLHLSPECVGFIKISVSPAPVIALSVVIDVNLPVNVRVFKGKVEIKRIGSECFPKVIMNVNVITTLLSDCEKMESGSTDESVEEEKAMVKDCLKSLQNIVKEDEKDIVGFLLQQTELLNVPKSCHTFTAAVLVVCCSFRYQPMRIGFYVAVV